MLLKYFGERLIKKSYDQNVEEVLTSKTYDFFINVGMPSEYSDNFYWFDEYFVQFERSETSRYIGFGQNGKLGDYLCIDVLEFETVVEYNPSLDRAVFINSDITKFVQFVYEDEQMSEMIKKEVLGKFCEASDKYSLVFSKQI